MRDRRVGVETRCHSWYEEALKATWRSPQDVKDQYERASICGNIRAVFNLCDRIDVETVNDH
ncbi:MAG: type II toxin-antitoxin system HigB family toxin [bacterium]